jgi:23S rRNA (cytosine1962-C5)-methyltransferase
MNSSSINDFLAQALSARASLVSAPHDSAFRLFSGFYEGEPDLTVDVYGKTLLLNTSAGDLPESVRLSETAQTFYLENLPWLECVVWKQREGSHAQKQGEITWGTSPATEIVEAGISYAIRLQMNQDASFYLDTRELRTWLKQNCAGKTVLNTFAYTGSLGIAALAGGAASVRQVDLNHTFLALARTSAMRNHLDLGRMKLEANDIFSEMGRLKKEQQLFDIVILDPPFFSVTEKGKVDLVSESTRMINKVRPLVQDGGYLVAINNALFLSGQEYMDSLQLMCADGYLEVIATLPVPADVTGYPTTIVRQPPTDPAPFDHSTKIALLKVKRKTTL